MSLHYGVLILGSLYWYWLLLVVADIRVILVGCSLVVSSYSGLHIDSCYSLTLLTSNAWYNVLCFEISTAWWRCTNLLAGTWLAGVWHRFSEWEVKAPVDLWQGIRFSSVPFLDFCRNKSFIINICLHIRDFQQLQKYGLWHSSYFYCRWAFLFSETTHH